MNDKEIRNLNLTPKGIAAFALAGTMLFTGFVFDLFGKKESNSNPFGVTIATAEKSKEEVRERSKPGDPTSSRILPGAPVLFTLDNEDLTRKDLPDGCIPDDLEGNILLDTAMEDYIYTEINAGIAVVIPQGLETEQDIDAAELTYIIQNKDGIRYRYSEGKNLVADTYPMWIRNYVDTDGIEHDDYILPRDCYLDFYLYMKENKKIDEKKIVEVEEWLKANNISLNPRTKDEIYAECDEIEEKVEALAPVSDNGSYVVASAPQSYIDGKKSFEKVMSMPGNNAPFYSGVSSRRG